MKFYIIKLHKQTCAHRHERCCGHRTLIQEKPKENVYKECLPDFTEQ